MLPKEYKTLIKMSGNQNSMGETTN